ncbi:hypothetical protein [Curtobacterium sp. MR_MD2014]|jgi:hypothetical protein|uniref:hypothetical protein n=1 Tax=Curtobacterium sp. MR_MD2014 TaxID=1561023 RepID=UPI00052AAC38|nr:hypothetical protein [Curtobacterium sp. MR_MD2014]AIV39517.1 hypothetical protein NI26_03330 [Curtobacterium sp. MR_MD2014]
MNPFLLWTAIAGGFGLLVTVLVSRRSSGRRADVPRDALEVAVAIVGAFLVLIGGALLAGPATRVLVVWLVVLLTVALFCTVLRVRSGATVTTDESVPQRTEALTAARRMLDRADYHQVSVVRVAVTLGNADLLATAFGHTAVEAARTELARALLAVVPPDALLWTEDRDRVVTLVREDECDLADWRGGLEAALATLPPDRLPTVPTASWGTTSTDDRGYRLEDLEVDGRT